MMSLAQTGAIAAVADYETPALNATVLLALEVSDAEVIAELKKHTEGAAREAYALGALRLGVLSLRQAAGELDATAIREAGQKLLSNLAELLAQRGTEITTDLSGALRQYFDPTTGALPSASKLSSAMMVNWIELSGLIWHLKTPPSLGPWPPTLGKAASSSNCSLPRTPAG